VLLLLSNAVALSPASSSSAPIHQFYGAGWRVCGAVVVLDDMGSRDARRRWPAVEDCEEPAMNCPTCNTPTQDTSKFCSRCGTQLAAAAAHAAPPGVLPRYAAPPPSYVAPAPYPPPAAAAGHAYAGAAGAAAASPAVDPAGLIQRIFNITLKPSAEWPVIAAEPPSLARVVVGCVLPLAAIQSLLSFVKMTVIGVSVPFAGNIRMPVGSSLSAALTGFVFAFIGLFVFALIINAWASFFGGRRSVGEALKVAAYAGVPAWLGSFFGVLPVLGTLIGLLAALYALYVLYLGLPVVMRAPKEKALGYTFAVVCSGILLGLVIGAAFAAVGGVGRFGMPRAPADGGIDRGAAITGGILGSVLGTDDKGKAALGQAIGNLARAGAEMERADAAAARAQTPADIAARTQRDAAQTGNVIGGMLGTDAQGRAALGAAFGNLARAGQQAEAANGTPTAAAPADAAAPDPANAANAGAAVGGLLTALGGALGGSQRVTPVDFRTLATLLPASVNGMPRGPTEGANKQAMGVKGSSASASYGGGGAGRIDVKISDVSGVAGLIDIASGLEQTTDAQTANGFERDASIGGRRVHEKYSNAGRHGELQVIVAKRFAVDVEGNGVDMAALEQALGQVDLGRLESMKGAGAQN
jgi:hypothetical protein